MPLSKFAEKMFGGPEQDEARKIKGVIDTIVVPHDSFRDAYRGVMECVMESESSREPVNCMLLGQGGSGKTTMADVIEKSFQAEIIQENDMEVDTVPVVVTSFKSMRSLDALVTDVLRKLGDFNPNSGRTPDKGDRAVELMKSCRTRIIIIDELHDLEGFEEGNLEAMRPFLKFIKAVTNMRAGPKVRAGPTVCLMGVERCKDMFEAEHTLEMSRRFRRKFILGPLVLGTKERPGTLPLFLQKMCSSILRRTSIQAFPPLASYELTIKIWAATSGNTAFVMTLIKEAVANAVLAKRYEVTVEDLADAWDSGFFNSVTVTKFNPFRATMADIVAAVRKKCV